MTRIRHATKGWTGETVSDETRGHVWVRWDDGARPTHEPVTVLQAETVQLADGDAEQTLMPGVEPIAPSVSGCAQATAAKAERRQHQPLEAGGLFDECATKQADMFA